MTDTVDGSKVVLTDAVNHIVFRTSDRGWGGIYSSFIALDDAKQTRILNAAFREFGLYGYKKTSTEQIAKAAGISKGMIFHYFGSKRGLFEYLFDYTSAFIEHYLGDLQQDMDSMDFIEQYRHATKIKLRAYTENPYVFEFFTTVYLQPENLDVSERVREVYEGTMQLRSDALASIINSGNTKQFRADMDSGMIKKYIAWVMDGYSNAIIAQLKGSPLADMQLEPYWVEVDIILDDMKKLFYTQES